MKAQELRIGNYVGINKTALHFDGCNSENAYFEIEELKKDVVQFKGFHVGEYYKDLKPIQLTEEWLLKLGFEKIKYYKFSLDEGYIIIEVEDENWEDLCLDVFIQTADMIKPFYITYLEHVHHLQNLYHALTGQELEFRK
tara:strand:+ start:74 stop:493 length:420 start_codon:yes stop_codon:yes gene_type:complete